MKKLLSMLLSIIMLITCTTFPTAVFASSNEKQITQEESKLNYKEGEAIAILKPQTSQKYFSKSNITALFGSSVKLDNSAVTAGSNSSTIFSAGNIKAAAFKSSSLSTKELIDKLEKDDSVLYAIPNYIFKATDLTNDTYSKYQWALQNDGFNGGTVNADTNPDSLWNKASSSNEEKIIAVCDSGIDYNHEDLKDSLWVNPYGAKLVGKYGYDFTGENKDNSPLDNNGHGTHVAGIIAAQADNEKGISGINKSNVKIMSLKWLDETGEGDTESVLASYDYIKRAVKLGANVVAVNNSWGGMADKETQELFDSVFDELGKLGVVSVVSAGNDACDVEYPEYFLSMFFDDATNVPASTTSDYALVVGATNEKDNLASFSSYSKKFVDVSAPGTDILSTVSYNCFNPSIYDEQQISSLCKDYQNFDGDFTSSSFAYPEIINNYTSDGKDVVTNATMSLSDDGFGYSGKSLKITTNDKATKEGLPYYYVSIPYTLNDENKNYSLSFMIKATKDTEVSVYDAPADVSPVQASYDYDGLIYASMFTGDDFWEHATVDFDVNAYLEYEMYTKSAQRQLVFEINAPDANTEISIDDLAVSNQDINTDDFGKYDYYNGTSMASPYVAGAVALVSNAYPDASTMDVINVIKNTGRINDSLADYTETSRVLSLDNSQNTPPLVTSVSYDNRGRVVIDGSFNDISAVRVNGASVVPISSNKSQIMISDNNYSTKKILLEVENPYGISSKTVVISNKKAYPQAVCEEGAPIGDNLIVPAGDSAYIISNGDVLSMAAMPSFEDETKLEAYYEYAYSFDYTVLFEEVSFPSVTSAVFMNDKIYFIAENPVFASNSAVIGCDKVFACLDLETEDTTKLCDIPRDVLVGQSLAVYNGNVYMLGGYDEDAKTYSNEFYKYDASKKSFVKTSYNLTQGRAYAKALQYKNKLYLVYGADSTNQMPKIMIFDGTKWTNSNVNFDSDDCIKYDDVNIFDGNIGYSSNGLYCVGSYVYSVGDSFSYNVSNDSITASEYCAKKSIGDNSVKGTTVYGMFVGYDSADDDLFNDVEVNSYALEMDTDFATVELDYEKMMDAPVELDFGYSYAHLYGDKVTVTATAEYGYIVTDIKAGSKTYSVNSKGKADIILTDSNTLVSATYKKVAPNKVTNLKVSATTPTSYTLSWSKPSRAAGYYVQQYKNKKWTTIATINNPNTTKYKVSKPATGTNQYRVRAFSNYNSKKYNGAFSSTLKVYVPTKQKIKSISAVSKGFTLTYTKNKSASGYEIQYSTNKKFSKAKTVNVKNNATISKKVTKLSANKTYYVKVRSYKTVNGKKIYGAWSAVKQIKTKK